MVDFQALPRPRDRARLTTEIHWLALRHASGGGAWEAQWSSLSGTGGRKAAGPPLHARACFAHRSAEEFCGIVGALVRASVNLCLHEVPALSQHRLPGHVVRSHHSMHICAPQPVFLTPVRFVLFLVSLLGRTDRDGVIDVVAPLLQVA